MVNIPEIAIPIKRKFSGNICRTMNPNDKIKEPKTNLFLLEIDIIQEVLKAFIIASGISKFV